MSSTGATVQIQEVVISQLHNGPCRPTQLLETLLRSGFTEAEVREAVAALLNEKKIELTSQRMLRIFDQVAA